jgi:hypothetical protein
MKTATALLLAVCASTVFATLPFAAKGLPLTPAAAWLSLAVGVACALYYWFESGPAGKPLKMGWPEWAAALLFALFALRAFCWLVFFDGDSVSVLSPNNLGDLPLHLTFIRYIARGAKLWPQNPIFSGLPLHYPAGIDIFNALLSLVGCDDFHALVWVALASSALTCYALLRWGGWFAVVGFLCNGGVAAWAFFHHFHFRLEDFQRDMAWKSIPLSMFVTQRGLLYAIPTGLLLLAVWRAQWFRDSDDPEPPLRMPVWVQVLLYGTMPLFHLHTFIFLSAILGWWIVLGLLSAVLGDWIVLGKEGDRLWYHVLDLILWSVLPATMCVSLVTGLFQRGQSVAGIIHLKPGWMQDDDGFFHFWLSNLGILPLLVLALVGWIVFRYRQDKSARNALAFVFPCLCLFVLACVVMFAPWEWDNMKLLFWCYLGILPCLHRMLLDIPGPQGVAARAVCYIALFFSGFLSLAGGLDQTHTGYTIMNRSELEPVRFAVRYLPPDATFAGFPTYNHPLLVSGCKMVEGYEGHLYSYGIDYQPRLAKLKAMMMGAPDWRQIADELHVRYLFWGAREDQAYPASTQPWKNLPVVAAGNWGTIYDLGATGLPVNGMK